MACVLSYTLSTVPANSQYLVVYDSTWGMNLPASAAAEPAPGNYRKRWMHIRRVKITVKIGAGDSVSIVFRAATDPTGTTAAAVFETDPDIATAGTYTLTASTTKTLDWKQPTADGRIYVLAGADNPASMITSVECYDDAEPGQ